VRVAWSPAALADVGRIYDYVARFNPPAARRLAQRLHEVADELEHFPHRGRPAEQGWRELTVARPYVLVYEIRTEEVRILRVWHGAQDRT
jgi:addiction module RelE/StbE family toxin